MTRTAVWCFNLKDVKSRYRFSRPETMRGISQNYQNLFLKRGTWSAVEDQMLKAYIKRYGIWNWNEMPKAAGLLRSGKSCRLRWMNYLRPDIKHGNFSKEEVQTIIKLHEMLGNRWSAIAAKLPGRTDNEIKNFWNTYLRNRFNNNISNTAVQAPKLQGTHAYEEESKQIKSSEIDVSPPTAPNILNSEEYSSKGTLPVSPILSTDNFSSSSSNPVNNINENQRMEENVGSLESFGEPSLWDQPFSMEAQMCKMEDYGGTYTDEMWVQELLYYPNASHNFECKQRNSSGIDVSLPTSPKILNSEEYSSNWTLPMSPILSNDNFSSSSSNPVNDSNENQRMEENVGSLESFGEPSLWDQPFSTEAQMCKLEDYGETYSNEMWVQELLYYPNASHNFESKQRSSSDIDVSLPTSPKILNSEENSSKGTLNMSQFLSTDNFSSSCSSPVNDINENQPMEENVGSLESFGELSFWDQPFSMEAQMCKVENCGETYTDKMWVQELLY